MIRIALVVSAFVVANAAGFLAYRATSRTVAPLRMHPASEATMSSPAIDVNRKPSEMTAPTPHPAPSSDVANSVVSKPTNQKTIVTSGKPSAGHYVRAANRKSVPEAPAIKPVVFEKSAEKNAVLDMDENPYKRGE